jgi:hypothetical protein
MTRLTTRDENAIVNLEVSVLIILIRKTECLRVI